MARRGFLSLEVDHRIIAAFVLAAAGWVANYFGELHTANASRDQRIQNLERRIDAEEQVLRDLRGKKP